MDWEVGAGLAGRVGLGVGGLRRRVGRWVCDCWESAKVDRAAAGRVPRRSPASSHLWWIEWDGRPFFLTRVRRRSLKWERESEVRRQRRYCRADRRGAGHCSPQRALCWVKASGVMTVGGAAPLRNRMADHVKDRKTHV